jgi:hypothetical protein
MIAEERGAGMGNTRANKAEVCLGGETDKTSRRRDHGRDAAKPKGIAQRGVEREKLARFCCVEWWVYRSYAAASDSGPFKWRNLEDEYSVDGGAEVPLLQLWQDPRVPPSSRSRLNEPRLGWPEATISSSAGPRCGWCVTRCPLNPTKDSRAMTGL